MHRPKISSRGRWALAIVCSLAAAGAAFGGCASTRRAQSVAPEVETSGASVAGATLRAAPPLECPRPPRLESAEKDAHVAGDPRTRAAAQRGLGFVAREAMAWQDQHKCYGCHVQAVTLEALAVGRHNKYEVPKADAAKVLDGLLTISGGARGPNPLSVSGSGGLIESGQEFGAAAFARWDEEPGSEVGEDLMRIAESLLTYQDPDGSLRSTDKRFPVVAGPMQSTTQAMQAWRRAYSRSADERWLAPLRAAEGYLQARARKLSDEPDANIVDLNYAAIGLLSAGAQAGEGVMRGIAERLRKAQRQDGSWGFSASEEGNAFATGQTLYALRMLGASDDDIAVKRGTGWLIEHQGEDGGWSHSGRGKAEAMWAVLGLVSVDVLSLAVSGVEDGQHLAGRVTLRASAVDNAGKGVERMTIAVDDVPVMRACGKGIDFTLDAGALAPGVHTIDVIAVNSRGQESRRRLEAYAGAYYLTQVGTRFTDGGTLISLRNVAPDSASGTVVLKVFSTRENDGRPVKAAEVRRDSAPSRQGAMRFFWDGKGADGASQARGRYVAELSFLGKDGKVVQTAEVPFVHDTLDAQAATYGEIAGELAIEGGAASANTTVELVDGQGRVVQSTVTTDSGNYRFRNVDGGKYKVRVSKAGFRAAEVPAAAAPSTKRAAPKMDLQAK